MDCQILFSEKKNKQTNKQTKNTHKKKNPINLPSVELVQKVVKIECLACLEKFSRQHFEIFSYFYQKTRFGISCKLSPKEGDKGRT